MIPRQITHDGIVKVAKPPYHRTQRQVYRKAGIPALTLKALKAGELPPWKRDNDYLPRALAATGMGRYTRLPSPVLRWRDDNGQVAAA